ncbi:MAG: pyridoxamine 5'-phosphate oxidase family protein [bacterium]|nr:pyridoxamine 5'-phosphate oxidase family protein [bacterium]
METAEIKKKILEFIKPHVFTVISTVHAGRNAPECACIGFVETENLELIFGTSNLSRKYKNIMANPNVSFVIGWDFTGTVQYEGEARELTSDEIDSYVEIIKLKNKQLEKFRTRPDQRFFIVAPKWIRLTLHTKSEVIHEIHI